jgi:hypothetical protein
MIIKNSFCFSLFNLTRKIEAKSEQNKKKTQSTVQADNWVLESDCDGCDWGDVF